MQLRNNKEPLSVTQRYTIRYTINGIFWLLFSILNLTHYKPLQILGGIFLMLASVCTFITIFAKQEPDDEMSYEHIWVAKSISLEIIFCAMMLIGILSMFVSFPFNKAYGFFIAGSQILSGLLFLKYEKGGC